MYWTNLPNCGEKLVKSQLPNYNSDIIVARSNFQGMVIRLRIETIDAAKNICWYVQRSDLYTIYFN